MKKYSIYIVTLIVGLLLGWVIFGGSSTTDENHEHELTQADNGMWTCSMHPQIMQPEAGDCPICGMDLIPAETSADGLAADQFKMTENAMALANIETAVIGMSDNDLDSNSLMLSGKIATNDKASATQTAHFGGRIEKLYYKSEGELIKNGALIASIYSPELVTAQNELIEALNIKEAQPELYKAVRNKLKFWKVSEKQIQSIEQTKKVITNFNMYANTSGYIQKVLVEEGNHVKEGSPLFKVANLSNVWANFDVYEQNIKNFKVGQTIAITLNAYPNKTIKAKLDYIDPILNATTRTVSARATLVNTNNLLKPGMLVSGEVQIATKDASTTTLSVPKTAVLWTGKRSVVYVKASKSEPIFQLREVNLGSASGENYTILSGLEEGEEIVTNGTFTIDASAQLQGKKSMMNKGGGKTTTGHEGHTSTPLSTSIDHSEVTSKHEDTSIIERLIVSSDFQKQLKTVVDSYLLLKDNLVADNALDVKNNASDLLVNLGKIDMKLLSNDNAHGQWMALEKDIKSTANAIASENEITNQRKHFKPLSSVLTRTVALFGINQKVYSQFCPMADNDKGAFWLSLNEEIRNPYYGDAMLKCGSIKQTIE